MKKRIFNKVVNRKHDYNKLQPKYIRLVQVKCTENNTAIYFYKNTKKEV